MGYFTTYSLHVEGENTEGLIAELRKENEDAEIALDDDGNTMDQAKWYTSDEDIVAFSAKHPNALFIMESQGEEGERACLFAKGGKAYKEHSPEWTANAFDESKLHDGCPGPPAENPYTVILQYPDTNEGGSNTWMGHVHGKDKSEAVLNARTEVMSDLGGDIDPEDLNTIAVIAGHHNDLNA